MSPRPAIALRSAARGERDAEAAPTLRARTVPTRAAEARSALEAPERCIASEAFVATNVAEGWRSRDARDELCGLGDASASRLSTGKTNTLGLSRENETQMRRVISNGSETTCKQR